MQHSANASWPDDSAHAESFLHMEAERCTRSANVADPRPRSLSAIGCRRLPSPCCRLPHTPVVRMRPEMNVQRPLAPTTPQSAPVAGQGDAGCCFSSTDCCRGEEAESKRSTGLRSRTATCRDGTDSARRSAAGGAGFGTRSANAAVVRQRNSSFIGRRRLPSPSCRPR